MDKVHHKNISHVAIIMDGNGRWAKNKNLDRSKGHKKGLDNIIPIVQELIDWKIKHITLSFCWVVLSQVRETPCC